jgi:hypothetical protein
MPAADDDAAAAKIAVASQGQAVDCRVVNTQTV